MPKKSQILASFFLLLLTLHCGGTKSKHGNVSTQAIFDFGRSTTASSLRQAVASVMRKFNHDLKIQETSIETEWRHLIPTESEEGLGIKEVRYKLFVNIKRRRRLSSADLRLHYEARYEKGDWEKTNPSMEMLGFIKTMQDEVKQRLQIYLPQQ